MQIPGSADKFHRKSLSPLSITKAEVVHNIEIHRLLRVDNKKEPEIDNRAELGKIP